MTTIQPCLWFDDQGEAAASFYVSLFPRSKITTITRYGDAAAAQAGRPKGSAITVAFELDGRPYLALNGGPMFQLTEAFSLMIECKDQGEVDRYWEALSHGGEESRCGWLKDRFGVSWQVVPRILMDMMGDADPKRSARVMAALMGMAKIDVAGLKRAYEAR